ncbi:hypothetical protein ACFWOL_17550 [Streptomyces sp. NPDC058442]|uniref:hypothetical protein n=1 Tax=Streptomyces sp. NPDC058442 TaxID=3346503 RepID=UPI00365B279B
MPAPTPGDIHAAAQTLARLTEYLRENPEPAEALGLIEPLLDEYTGVPVQLADALRALARAVQEHPATPHTVETDLLIQELRTAAWEQADQHTLHYALDDLRSLYRKAPETLPECGPCP